MQLPTTNLLRSYDLMGTVVETRYSVDCFRVGIINVPSNEYPLNASNMITVDNFEDWKKTALVSIIKYWHARL